SLAYRTDLIFPAFEGRIVDRGDYMVILSPSNPTYYWGNFLLFSAPAREGDFDRWRDLFKREIGEPPRITHMAFGWDGTDGAAGFVEPFVQANFQLEHTVVLAAAEPVPPLRPNADIEIHTLSSDADWNEAIELQVSAREGGHTEADYRTYREDACARYRRMEAAGRGHWYGAYLDGRLVADLGVFHDEHGLGRYQSVETHPDFRRQGIAGTLVYEAGRRAIREHGLHTLIILADDEGDPARMYQSVGFKPTEKSAGLVWWEGKPPRGA
ncbi:MAG TPA: GNAT family N-acetyltransferase, partial [Anaerolineales bacterium]